MKKIMILGAGIYQVPLYRAARRRGLETVAVSIPGHYPGFALADRALLLDTRDRDGIVGAARREAVCAIVTTGTDVAMPALGAVRDALGLPGVSLEAALRATDKIRMKEAFQAGGVRTSAFRAVSALAEARAAAEEIGYPIMVKIPDQSGSRGITRVDAPEGLEEAWMFSRSHTGAPRLLVEGFVKGTEFGVDAAVQHGRILTVIPHEKRVHDSGRTGVPAGHLCPADFPEETLRRMREETGRVIQALGLDDCAVNIDAILTPEGEVSVIEAAARCGGTGIPEVLSGHLGLDWYDVILDLALDIPVSLPETGKRAAASRMITAERGGILHCLSYEAGGQRRENQDYEDEHLRVTLNAAPGERVSDFVNGTERLGQAVFIADSRAEVLRAEAEFMRGLNVEVAEEKP